MNIQPAETDVDVLAAFPVLRQLRPQLIEADFVARIRGMAAQGFRLVCLTDPDVRAVAGYRRMDTLRGTLLYVDDLVTDAAHRSQRYGQTLLAWLRAEAVRTGCKYLELDSGLTRLDAHRFYRREGREDIGLHFSTPTDGSPRWTAG